MAGRCSECGGDGEGESPHNGAREECYKCRHLYAKCPACDGFYCRNPWASSPHHCIRCDGYGRIKKCGMGYPSMGLPCIRPEGHQSPVSDCFAVSTQSGKGVYMQQDGKDWVGTDRADWPDDVLIDPEPKPEPEPMPPSNRRAAIAATKAKNAAK